jgi:hypothetical protein
LKTVVRAKEPTAIKKQEIGYNESLCVAGNNVPLCHIRRSGSLGSLAFAQDRSVILMDTPCPGVS